MSAVTRYEAGTVRDSGEESRLWSTYLTALAVEQRLRYESENAWRRHVIGDLPASVWTAPASRFEAARVETAAALTEWARFAYPLHGWPLPKAHNRAA